MRTHPFALLAAVLLLVISGVGTASASTSGQAAEQVAGNDQSASSSAGTTQVAPSNSNIDVRIFSPGSNGDVTQTNGAGSVAAAGNANSTDQTATQQGGATQAAGQVAGSEQDADAEATTEQVKPSNENVSVRIGSPGANGDVEQTNAAGSAAAAGNLNTTDQTADQQGGGDCKCGGSGEQVAAQGAHNDQQADAEAKTEQIKPSNSNVTVRIGSPGSNGSVDQSNVADSIAAAGNANATNQSVEQDGGSGGVQAVGQEAKSEQDADADATTKQIAPSNENTSVRIGSPGADGDVTQTNVAESGAIAANGNWTDQSAEQAQDGGCGCHGGTGVQAVGQWADSEQDAEADATTIQGGASNSNTPVRIGSPGGSGDVTQANLAGSLAVAGNANHTDQAVGQAGGGVQAVGQVAKNDQEADASATTKQWKPSNVNAPVAIGGGHDCGCGPKTAPAPSGGGDVTQINAAGSAAFAVNKNRTDQTADQSQGRKPAHAAGHADGCGCDGGGVQAIGQFAFNKQRANADATTAQIKPSNVNAPVAIGGDKDGHHDDGKWSPYGAAPAPHPSAGSVRQANLAFARALSVNLNGLTQEAVQE